MTDSLWSAFSEHHYLKSHHLYDYGAATIDWTLDPRFRQRCIIRTIRPFKTTSLFSGTKLISPHTIHAFPCCITLSLPYTCAVLHKLLLYGVTCVYFQHMSVLHWYFDTYLARGEGAQIGTLPFQLHLNCSVPHYQSNEAVMVWRLTG